MWTDLEKQLLEWESDFETLWKKEYRERNEEDRRYLSRELPQLKEAKTHLERRLKQLQQIIAKTRQLLRDLDEDYCRELTHGHSLTEVKSALRKKFGSKLDEDFELGRRHIRRFLEEQFGISKKESRELFALLQELEIVRYRVELPENVVDIPIIPVMDDIPEEYTAFPETVSEIYGHWEIAS